MGKTLCFQPRLKASVWSATCERLILATHKRVCIFERHLVCKLIFFEFILDVFRYPFCILTRSKMVRLLFPLRNSMKLGTHILGVISTSMWMWSGHTLILKL